MFENIIKQQNGQLSVFCTNFRYLIVKNDTWLNKHYEKLAKARRDKYIDFAKKLWPVKKDDLNRKVILDFTGGVICKRHDLVEKYPKIKGRMIVSGAECKKCEHRFRSRKKYHCKLHMEANKKLVDKIWKYAVEEVRKLGVNI